MKEAREIKEKMIADAKAEAQAEGAKMIEQAKAAIESEKNAAMAELEIQVSVILLKLPRKSLKTNCLIKTAQTKW